MKTSTVLSDASMLTLSVLIGAGSVVMFALLQSVQYLSMGWPDRYVLLWDALLSLAFFAQHSVMVRRPIRARLSAVLPARYQGALYSIASGVVLALVVVLWQRSGTRVFALQGAPRWIAQALSLLAVAAFVQSAMTLRRSFDPLGLGPIRAHLRGNGKAKASPYHGNGKAEASPYHGNGKAEASPYHGNGKAEASPYQERADSSNEFVVRGPYLWVRHPLYSCVLVLFWTNSDVTRDQLLLNVLWTIWIWIGAMLEERDLVAQFGCLYRAYQRRVPMFVPWRGRVNLGGGVESRPSQAVPGAPGTGGQRISYTTTAPPPVPTEQDIPWSLSART